MFRLYSNLIPFSLAKKSLTPIVFVSKHVTEDRKIKDKIFWSPIYTKYDKTRVDVIVKIFGPNHILSFFSKYVVVNFYHFSMKDTLKGDNVKIKKNWDTTPL